MTGDTLKIGVLLPQSSIYPTLGQNLIAGIQLQAMQSHGPLAERKLQFITEDIGFGQSLAEQKALKLTGFDAVDLVVGVVSTGVAAIIRDIFQARQTLFIANTIGENILRHQEHSPFIFYNSLSHWQSNLALGRWAARHLGKQAFITMSFYDSGYDTPYAFRMGLEHGGGTVLRTYMSHRPPDTGDFKPLFAHIKDAQPDFVYAAYCGPKATTFVQAYAQSEFAGRIPLVGTGFLTDDALLSQQGTAALGVKTCLPWASDLESSANQHFISSYQEMHQRTPDVFALLGFETGYLIDQALQARGDLRHIEAVRESLLRTAFISPRGRLTMNPDTQTTATPLYIREVQRQGDRLSNVPIAQVDPLAEEDEQIQAMRSSPHSGWLNAYLCV